MNSDLGRLSHLLRNVAVRDLVTALERDGFQLDRDTQTGSRIYVHQDGRIAVIHYHHGNDTLTRRTLRSVLRGTRWTADDLDRLGLV